MDEIRFNAHLNDLRDIYSNSDNSGFKKDFDTNLSLNRICLYTNNLLLGMEMHTNQILFRNSKKDVFCLNTISCWTKPFKTHSHHTITPKRPWLLMWRDFTSKYNQMTRQTVPQIAMFTFHWNYFNINSLKFTSLQLIRHILGVSYASESVRSFQHASFELCSFSNSLFKIQDVLFTVRRKTSVI